MLIRDDGTIIRMPLDQVSVFSRNTQGVRLMRVDEGTRVVSVEIVPHSDEEEAPAEATEAAEPSEAAGTAEAKDTTETMETEETTETPAE